MLARRLAPGAAAALALPRLVAAQKIADPDMLDVAHSTGKRRDIHWHAAQSFLMGFRPGIWNV
ncbi:hypothetical protein GCM10011504_18460 [Siccirubricoccus deserti]|uniref:Uncharacterized protein n=1 Tax=Siccirubricoccus deserti TaxID=2013562 RepID=A0A9X0R1A7_9PROT|nr:hypothetical protein [Siccirubricoccus deserti]MBC4017705.1 hypothetical protein [Siccirubricoccus deserti]GGC40309.1 hypothetical protein GCM10011504_18460 [Siccirubricoccus deserti]